MRVRIFVLTLTHDIMACMSVNIFVAKVSLRMLASPLEIGNRLKIACLQLHSMHVNVTKSTLSSNSMTVKRGLSKHICGVDESCM